MEVASTQSIFNFFVQSEIKFKIASSISQTRSHFLKMICKKKKKEGRISRGFKGKWGDNIYEWRKFNYLNLTVEATPTSLDSKTVFLFMKWEKSRKIMS